MRRVGGAPDFEEFERTRQQAVESLGSALRTLQRDPNEMHGEWLLDTLAAIEVATNDGYAFRKVATAVIDASVPRGPQAMPAGDL